MNRKYNPKHWYPQCPDCVQDMEVDLHTAGISVDDGLREAVIMLIRERDVLRAALVEIARGKSQDDVGCLASEWMLMAGRLVRIAQDALKKRGWSDGQQVQKHL